MDSAQARNRRVEAQIARRGVHDPQVLEAMRTVPCEAFISAGDARRHGGRGERLGRRDGNKKGQTLAERQYRTAVS